MILGGERALPERLADWMALRGGARLVNTYGPTEATVVATRHELAAAPQGEWAGREVPIGRPIHGVHAHVLDASLRPVPAGAPAQLFVGGAGLARGYLGRPELTAERFVPDPFSPVPGGRLYATGDLARRGPDGVLEFAGRIDGQVKVRGFRIEPGEVEAALREHPDVRDAVIVAREDTPGARRLVAYVVAEGEPAPAARELREFLGEILPEYMVPAAFAFLRELPTTPGGKVDRRALPAPEATRPEEAEGFLAPRTPTEELLAGIWAGVLEHAAVGVQDDFFELGGDSIRAIQVVTRARQAGIPVHPRQLFRYPTVARLAAVLGDLPAGGSPTVPLAAVVAQSAGAGAVLPLASPAAP